MQIALTANPRGIDSQTFEADDHFGPDQALFHAGKKVGAAGCQTCIGTMPVKQLCRLFYGCRTKMFKLRQVHRCHIQLPTFSN